MENKTLLVYTIDPTTSEFTGTRILSEDEGDLGHDGNWLIPYFATDKKPPEVMSGYAIVFDRTLNDWTHKVDNRGKTYWNKDTKECLEVEEIGSEVQGNYTDIQPTSTQKWDYSLNGWVDDKELTDIQNNKKYKAFLSSTDWLIIRHQDQLESIRLGVRTEPTSLSDEEYKALLQERQDARDNIVKVDNINV